MSLIVDRSVLLQASWTNTVRLARWIGAKRLPTCSCPSCRAVVVAALDRYLQGRSWTNADARARSAGPGPRAAVPVVVPRRRSRSTSTQACGT